VASEDWVDPDTGEIPERLHRRLFQLQKLKDNPDEPFFPFPSRWAVELAAFVYSHAKLSEAKANKLFKLLALDPKSSCPFRNYQHLLQHIDSIPVFDIPYQEATVTPAPYRIPPCDPRDDSAKAKAKANIPGFWKGTKFRYRDPIEIVEHLLARSDLAEHFHSRPFRTFNDRGDRVVSDYFSANKVMRVQVPDIVCYHRPSQSG